MLEKHPAEQVDVDSMDNEDEFGNQSEGSDDESVESLKESRIW